MNECESKYSVVRESVMVSHHDGSTRTLYRWVVRRPDTSLYGYSSTYFGAWRMVYQAHVRKWPE